MQQQGNITRELMPILMQKKARVKFSSELAKQ
jgi:hypothetical protein